MSSKNCRTMKGSEIAIRCLEKQGVDVVFAYPGGMAIELHQALIDSPIRVILPRHEQGGAFAANGYARATGKVGVAMATSGPGATNLVSGIADAYMDSVPTVFITGQVPTTAIGKNVFQETDIIGMTRPVVKHSFLVLSVEEIPSVISEAFYLAAEGRPGPVVIDIPKNVQQALCDFDPAAEVEFSRRLKPAPLASDEEIEAVRKLICESKRPCVYAGGGIISSNASAELRQFIESWNLPVTNTLMAFGAIPADHPLNLSWLGMHGTVYANFAANECDLLLALGARFDDRVTGNPANFASRAKIVHIDIDESEINKNKRADIGIVSDIKGALEKLNRQPVRQENDTWFARIAGWKKQYPRHYRVCEERVQPQFVVEELCKLTGGEAIIVPGVGQHQMWAAQYYDYHFPRQLLTSGGLGAMGFGLPAAMGAKVARPDRLVVNIDGDGSFQMNIQELGTLHVEEIGVKIIILNNQHLGMVAQWEDRFYGRRRGNTVLGRRRGSCAPVESCRQCNGSDLCSGAPFPDFVTIAKGFGIPARAVSARSELKPALQEMLDTEGAFLLDVYTGYDDHVLPMIPPGKDYRSILTE